MTFILYPDARRALAMDSLAGLSVGEALGAQFFAPGGRAAELAAGRTPPPPWPWTDDTEMACCLIDTVPFAIWVAAEYLDDCPAGVTACVSAGGDIDTTAAIAGGVVAAYTGSATPSGVPADWLAAREPLPHWLTRPDDPNNACAKRLAVTLSGSSPQRLVLLT